MPIEEDLLQLGAQNTLLHNCAPATLEAINQHGTLCTCPAGAMVLGEGEAAGCAFLPLQGKLQVSKTAASGRRQVFCAPGACGCGDLCMFFMTERSLADIHTTEPSRFVMLPLQDTIDLTLVDPVFHSEAWSSVKHCLAHLTGMVEDLSFQGVRAGRASTRQRHNGRWRHHPLHTSRSRRRGRHHARGCGPLPRRTTGSRCHTPRARTHRRAQARANTAAGLGVDGPAQNSQLLHHRPHRPWEIHSGR